MSVGFPPSTQRLIPLHMLIFSAFNPTTTSVAFFFKLVLRIKLYQFFKIQ
ncbi:hypothetical protein FDUTEX481_10008 [Tolypothrix sp. PCC 7601]|nr:hypothetical protein FDUTEX481_10008 [Tolypothrix sp. PCC 7601]